MQIVQDKNQMAVIATFMDKMKNIYRADMFLIIEVSLKATNVMEMKDTSCLDESLLWNGLLIFKSGAERLSAVDLVSNKQMTLAIKALPRISHFSGSENGVMVSSLFDDTQNAAIKVWQWNNMSKVAKK